MILSPNSTNSFNVDDFYVVATEPGNVKQDIPIWASKRPGAIKFDSTSSHAVERVKIPEVPGAWQLLDVLNVDECDRLVELSEALGYHDDAPVSLPRRILHTNNFNWVVDESVDGPIWNRCKGFFEASTYTSLRPCGLNARFRFYRYVTGDFFAPHADGVWPGSRVVDGRLVHDAYGDRISEMTFLIFLTDGYGGGRTQFQTRQNSFTSVTTPKGAILYFPHGTHPQHCIHAGEEVTSGQKYIIRTDVLFG
ncbi:MAG: 2OG-Fe(II) oxygenase [Alphaproteobacteria bacterium]